MWWGSGPAVLLVHGWCGRSTQLGGLVKPLIEAGRSVFAIDCWGHGDSPGQESHGVAFVESIMLCNQEHGPFDAVIGHSLGATATLVAAGRGLKISRAVLLAPPEMTTAIKRFVRKKKLSDDAIRAFTPALERKVRMREEDFLLKQVAGNVKIPVMIVHDPADREVPIADAREIAQNLQQGVLVQVSGCGHRLLVKASEVINTAVDFVTGASVHAVIQSATKRSTDSSLISGSPTGLSVSNVR